MADRSFALQWAGYGLTTAEITYHMPDYRHLLQTFVWQEYDLAPNFPKLTKFLDFWAHKLEGPLEFVRVAHSGLITPAEFKFVGSEWRLH